jgi:uncharacterized membrane protein YcaP (DUF421 family)
MLIKLRNIGEGVAREVRNMGLLDIIVLILVISWLGGFALHVGGSLIHLLLVIAVVVLLARLLGFKV